MDNYENPAYTDEAVRILRNKGYQIALPNGVKVDKPESYAIGILDPSNLYKRRILGIKIGRRASYVGIIWFDSEFLKVKHDEKWLLEVFGKEYVPKLTELIEGISEQFGADLEVRLLSEKPERERYFSEVGVDLNDW